MVGDWYQNLGIFFWNNLVNKASYQNSWLTSVSNALKISAILKFCSNGIQVEKFYRKIGLSIWKKWGKCSRLTPDFMGWHTVALHFHEAKIFLRTAVFGRFPWCANQESTFPVVLVWFCCTGSEFLQISSVCQRGNREKSNKSPRSAVETGDARRRLCG